MVIASSATRLWLGRSDRRPVKEAGTTGYNIVTMYYVYVLFSLKSKRLYTGSTNDLKRRFKEHNDGLGGAYSKRNRPFILVFYEAFIAKSDALKQEKFYKSGYGREVLQNKIKGSLGEILDLS